MLCRYSNPGLVRKPSPLHLANVKHGWSSVSGPMTKRRWLIVTLLTLSAVINYLDRATLSMALPGISADLSLGPEAKGLLLSVLFWSYALMQIPMGWLADRHSVRWLYAGSFALWSVAYGLTGLCEKSRQSNYFPNHPRSGRGHLFAR